MKKNILATVLSNTLVANATYEMRLMTEKRMQVIPGQFANFEIPDSALLLRRPISINNYVPETGEMLILYKTVGKGTACLSKLKKDDLISVIMPLGNGFKLLDSYQDIYLVGGGVGCPAVESVIYMHPDRNYTSFLGFETESNIYHMTSFKQHSEAFYITTVDGSAGEKGLVTAPLKKALERKVPDVLLACGPMPMLKAIQDVMKAYTCDAYISAEQRMGCGIGGCTVCVIATTSGNKRVCDVGPVFRLDEVVF